MVRDYHHGIVESPQNTSKGRLSSGNSEILYVWVPVVKCNVN